MLHVSRDGHTAPHHTGPFSLPWAARRANSTVPRTQSSTTTSQAQNGPQAVVSHWTTVGSTRPNRKHRLSDADTELNSPPPSTVDVSSVSSIVVTSSPPDVGTSAMSSPVVLESDSDDEIDQSYGSGNGTHASLASRSARSSDRYYDSGHEAACRAYIREEDTLRVANVSTEI